MLALSTRFGAVLPAVGGKENTRVLVSASVDVIVPVNEAIHSGLGACPLCKRTTGVLLVIASREGWNMCSGAMFTRCSLLLMGKGKSNMRKIWNILAHIYKKVNMPYTVNR